MLFKSSEVPPPVTEDRGFCAKRQASEVSLHLVPYGIPEFHSVTLCGIETPVPLTGLEEDIQTV